MNASEIYIGIWIRGKTDAEITRAIQECIDVCGEPSSASSDDPDRIVLRFPRGQQDKAA